MPSTEENFISVNVEYPVGTDLSVTNKKNVAY